MSDEQNKVPASTPQTPPTAQAQPGAQTPPAPQTYPGQPIIPNQQVYSNQQGFANPHYPGGQPSTGAVYGTAVPGNPIYGAPGAPIYRVPANPAAAYGNPYYQQAGGSPIQNGQPGFQGSMLPQVRAFAEAVKPVYVLGILSLVTCLGIGLIFEIINLVKIKHISIPDASQIRDPYELAEFQTAEKKLKTARTCTSIAYIITGIALFICFLSVMIAIQT